MRFLTSFNLQYSGLQEYSSHSMYKNLIGSIQATQTIWKRGEQKWAPTMKTINKIKYK